MTATKVRWQWSPARVAAAVVVALIVAMWSYVLYLAIGPGREPPIDRLEDPSFAQAAEERCAEAVADVALLPDAADVATSQARADVLVDANRIFGRMLDDLERLVPAGPDAQYVDAWLADWRLYFGDRIRYAEALRTDPAARFLVSEKPGQGRHVTGWIDEFARANRMMSCATPDDV